MNTTINVAAVLLFLPLISYAGGNKSIYGKDDQLDYFEAPRDLQVLSDSVVSLWKSGRVEIAGGKVKLKTAGYGDAFNLCPGEHFREQPVGAYCSGSLVGEDLVLTAGHCVKTDAACADMKFVFGFDIRNGGEAAATVLSASEAYGCSKVIARRYVVGAQAGLSQGADYALIQLDRKVTGHQPLPINRGEGLKKGDAIVMIGHLSALPLKVAGGASVRDASKADTYLTDLDGGLAGSPVFNARTKKIEGLYVQGDPLFETEAPDGCITVTAYGQGGGPGEEVTRVSALSSFIPALPGEKAAGKTLEVREMPPIAMPPAGQGRYKVASFD